MNFFAKVMAWCSIVFFVFPSCCFTLIVVVSWAAQQGQY